MRTLLPPLLVVISWLHPAQADEKPTFCGNTVEGWIRVLRDKTSTKGDHQRAVWALGCFGTEARAAVPDLIEEIRQGQFKDEATEALVCIGAGTDVTIPSLIEQFLKEGCQHLTGMGAFGLNSYTQNRLVRIGGPAVPALLEVLKGPNTDMRVCAAEALGEIGPAARAAVPALIHAIEHPDMSPEAEILIRHAAQALGRIGPEAKAALPALNGLLDKGGDYDFDVVMALDAIGVPPVRKLLDKFLREGDSFVAFELSWLGPKAREATPSLLAALNDQRPQVRFSAAVALAHIDSSATEAIPVLIEALNHLADEDVDVGEVPPALALFGPRAKAALPALIGIVKKGFEDGEILKALVQIDPEGKECIPALIAALKHDEYEVVHVAANCLSLLGPRAGEAVPALVAAVTRDFGEGFANGFDPQASAANALRWIGPRARSAIPALIAALKYRHAVRRGAEDAGEERERDSMAAAAAAQVLGSFGADAKAAVPDLIETVQTRDKDDGNWTVRKAAILALGQVGPDAWAAIPVLRSMMKEVGSESQYLPEVMVALSQLAPDGKELAERWLARSTSALSEPELRLGLEGRAMVLGALGRTSLETDRLTRHYMERLDSMLTDPDPRDGLIEIYEGWFEIIGRLGPAGRLAVPRLEEHRKHPDPWVRMWALETLERIMPPTTR